MTDESYEALVKSGKILYPFINRLGGKTRQIKELRKIFPKKLMFILNRL